MSITHPSFGTLDDDRIIIFDTTLRDGEQSPGFSMNLDEKIRMAEALTELGVDVLEAGFAIASPGDLKASRRSPKASDSAMTPRHRQPRPSRSAGRVARGGRSARGKAPSASISSSPPATCT